MLFCCSELGGITACWGCVEVNGGVFPPEEGRLAVVCGAVNGFPEDDWEGEVKEDVGEDAEGKGVVVVEDV